MAVNNIARQIDALAETIETLDVSEAFSKERFQQIHPDMSDEEVEILFAAFDSDGDGLLEYEEYLALLDTNPPLEDGGRRPGFPT